MPVPTSSCARSGNRKGGASSPRPERLGMPWTGRARILQSGSVAVRFARRHRGCSTSCDGTIGGGFDGIVRIHVVRLCLGVFFVFHSSDLGKAISCIGMSDVQSSRGNNSTWLKKTRPIDTSRHGLTSVTYGKSATECRRSGHRKRMAGLPAGRRVPMRRRIGGSSIGCGPGYDTMRLQPNAFGPPRMSDARE